jgi:3-oxoacyl-[acyl-carrier-protein] synthase II
VGAAAASRFVNARRTAVITGAGALSPLGHGVEALWDGLLAGRVGLAPIRGFDTTGCTNTIAGEVKGFVPEEMLSSDEARRLDRASQFALVAVREALAESRLDLSHVDRTRVGVILATTLGGMLIGEAYQRRQRTGAPFDVRQLLHVPYYAVAARLARELGVRGPVVSPSIACASGTHAIGLGLELIRHGHGDVFVVGGVETLCPFVVNGFNCLRATAAEAARPFDARRDGLLLGEGAAVLVVEAAEHAAARGVRAGVEVAGAALSGDAAHITAPARDGAGAARAMRGALGDAGISADAVDFISAHGTGTVYNDAMEVAAITSVLGARARRVPVNSIKGAIGHTLGAAGTFEAIMSARVIETGVIPPTVNCEEIDPACHLDIVRGEPRHLRVHTVLSTSSAFAGNNAAIVLRRQRPATGDGRPSTTSTSMSTPASSVAADGRATEPTDTKVAITGIGVVTPLGSSLAEITGRFAQGEAPSPGPQRGGAGMAMAAVPLDGVSAAQRSRVGRLDRFCQLLFAASHRAVDAARLVIDPDNSGRIGLSFGTALGCLLTNAEYDARMVEAGPGAASPRLFAYTVSSAAGGEVSIALGIKGPNVTAHMGFAAGLGAVGYGVDLIQLGKADVVLAAGADALGPALAHALRDMRLLKGPEATRPFRDATPGLHPGEAAVVVVLEAREHAQRRGAHVLCEVEGYAAGFEPTLTRPDRRADGITATLRRALARCGRPPDTAAVLASAHGTPLDEVERSAITEAFGSGPLLLAPKAVFGETFGASGALALALGAGVFDTPPAAFADGVALGVDGSARSGAEARRRLLAADAVLVCSLCYTGNVVALVLSRAAGDTAPAGRRDAGGSGKR